MVFFTIYSYGVMPFVEYTFPSASGVVFFGILVARLVVFFFFMDVR